MTSGIRDKKYIYYLLFLLIFCVLFWIIFPIGVDTPFHILRISELGRELSRSTVGESRFPVYMYRDVYNHFGYPIPIFYCALFLYPYALLTIAGVSAVFAYKLAVVSVIILTYVIAVLCVGCTTELRNTRHTVAFIYVAQPFFWSELIYRGSLGSANVFMFIPMVLLGIYFIVTASRGDLNRIIRGILCLGCGMAGIVMSHVISTVVIAIALTILLIVTIFRVKNRLGILLSVFLSASLCFLLTAWYICPMLEQLLKYQFRNQTVTHLQQGKVELIALLLPAHLSVAISAFLHTEVPKSAIGGCVVPVLLLTVYIIVSRRIRKLRQEEWVLLIIYYLLNGSLLVDAIWKSMDRTLSFMQFSWRFYPVVSVIGVIVLVLAFGLNDDVRFRRGILIICIVSAVYSVFFVFAFFAVRKIAPDYISSYAGHEVTSYKYSSETSDELYLPYMMEPDAIRRAYRRVTCSSSAIRYTYEIDEESGCAYSDIIDNNSDEECVMTFPFIMYDGYSAVNENDGELYSIIQGPEGLADVIIPPGARGRVRVTYTGTLIQSISYYVSLIASVILIAMILIYGAGKRYVRHCNQNRTCE